MSEYYRKPIVKILMLKGKDGDGKGISSISKTGTSGLVDTYTITLTDGTKSTFTVTNGKEISSIDKTGTSGLVDTYTITFNDGTTSTFTVTNGDSSYKPAVEALRTQVSELKSDIDDLKNSGGSGSGYTLPIATPTQLGGVMPVAKTDEMTQEVGIDGNGGLFTKDGGGSSQEYKMVLIKEITSDGTATSFKEDVELTNGLYYLIQDMPAKIIDTDENNGQQVYASVSFSNIYNFSYRTTGFATNKDLYTQYINGVVFNISDNYLNVLSIVGRNVPVDINSSILSAKLENGNNIALYSQNGKVLPEGIKLYLYKLI